LEPQPEALSFTGAWPLLGLSFACALSFALGGGTYIYLPQTTTSLNYKNIANSKNSAVSPVG